MEKSRKDTRWMVSVALMAAIVILLATLFFKKPLTNRSKFAAKPIDYILFQSTGGDFFVTY